MFMSLNVSPVSSPYREDEEEEAGGGGAGMSAVQRPIGWERGGDE